ncbi:MAG: nuclear transport factor 2 family protein [Chloroflexi bacterium]|nr:nuclear transport factor 2 family protein [Chloroflexota bacterium]
MADDTETIVAVRAMLQRFQEGYTRRDTAQLDSFMELFAPDPLVEVIGTAAVAPSAGEWCRSRQAVRELVESDWLTWGDLRLDVEGARISSRGAAAWLSTTGIVSQPRVAEQGYQHYLDNLGALKTAERPAEERLLRIMLECAEVLYELRRGENFVWPLRFSAMLTREAGGWKFRQMQFCYPTTRFPDERVLGEQ